MYFSDKNIDEGEKFLCGELFSQYCFSKHFIDSISETEIILISETLAYLVKFNRNYFINVLAKYISFVMPVLVRREI